MNVLRSSFLGLLGGVLVALWCVLPVQAATITFDEFEAYQPDTTPTPINQNTYAYMGVYFSPGGSPSNTAGTITEGGTWGLTGNNGPQFAGWSVEGGSSGFEVAFADPLTSFSIWVAQGEGSDVDTSITFKLYTDTGVLAYQESLEETPSEQGTWEEIDLTYYISAMPAPITGIVFIYDSAGFPNMGFDNMTFTHVPVPATFLLLGSGLISLMMRRRTKIL